VESVAALRLLLSFVNSASKMLKRNPSLEIISSRNSESSLRVVYLVNLLTENRDRKFSKSKQLEMDILLVLSLILLLHL